MGRVSEEKVDCRARHSIFIFQAISLRPVTVPNHNGLGGRAGGGSAWHLDERSFSLRSRVNPLAPWQPAVRGYSRSNYLMGRVRGA